MNGSGTGLPNVPFVHVNIGLLADDVGVATTNTFDGSQSVHNLLLTINVGVKETNDVLEVLLIGNNQRLSQIIVRIGPKEERGLLGQGTQNKYHDGEQWMKSGQKEGQKWTLTMTGMEERGVCYVTSIFRRPRTRTLGKGPALLMTA